MWAPLSVSADRPVAPPMVSDRHYREKAEQRGGEWDGSFVVWMVPPDVDTLPAQVTADEGACRAYMHGKAEITSWYEGPGAVGFQGHASFTSRA